MGRLSKLSVLNAPSIRATAFGAAALAALVLASQAGAVEVYDSGWAVSSPEVESRPWSVLGPSNIRLDRVLGKRTLEDLQIPFEKHQDESALKWRPARIAQRPTKQVYPPLPLAGDKKPAVGPTLDEAFQTPETQDAQVAPEMQALPEHAEPQHHKPAPFDPSAAKPIGRLSSDNTAEAAAPAQAPAREPAPKAVDDTPSQVEAPRKLETALPETLSPTKPAPESDSDKATPDKESSDGKVVIEDQGKSAQEVAPKKKPQPNTKNFITPKEVEKPPRKLRPLTRNEQYLRRKLRSVLSYYYRRPLNSVDHNAWEVMHGMLSYGLYSRVQDGSRRGRPVTSIGFLCFNKPCERYRMFYLTPEGRLDVRVGVGLQGHKGQLLAMLAQCNVSPDYPIKVEGKDFTIRDLIESEQLTCYERSELSFKLIGLMHYLPSDSTWVNDQGETWDFPKLIADERTQKIRGAACGGTHRLSGLTLAVKKRKARGEPVDGEWQEAEKFISEYQNYAFRLQNRDGSLSTEWFRGPGAEEDIDRRIRTTGHLLEWLLYSLDDEQLDDRRVFTAVNYLTNLITSNTDNGWEIGPLAHALHALYLYDQRAFQPYDSVENAKLAGRNSKRPVTLSYHQLNSGISQNYAYIQEQHEERVARENSGFGGLFGFGNSSRHSR